MGRSKSLPPIDWEAIEREYRAGQRSVKELGRSFGTSHCAILIKARKLGWTRNLSEAVRSEIRSRLAVASDSDEPPREFTSQDARHAVDTAAARGVGVVLAHRSSIAVLRRSIDRISADLERRLLTVESAPMREFLDLTTSADTLARATGRVVALERQAFNLDDAGGTDEPGFVGEDARQRLLGRLSRFAQQSAGPGEAVAEPSAG